MVEAWREPRDWFLAAAKDQQVRYLSALLFELSISARGTYEVGTENLLEPKEMRCFNELFHRIAQQQLAIIEDDPNRRPNGEFFEYLALAASEVNVSTESLLQRLSRQLG